MPQRPPLPRGGTRGGWVGDQRSREEGCREDTFMAFQCGDRGSSFDCHSLSHARWLTERWTAKPGQGPEMALTSRSQPYPVSVAPVAGSGQNSTTALTVIARIFYLHLYSFVGIINHFSTFTSRSPYRCGVVCVCISGICTPPTQNNHASSPLPSRTIAGASNQSTQPVGCQTRFRC